jgi:hypothetical protein
MTMVNITSFNTLYDADTPRTGNHANRTIRNMPDPEGVYRTTLGHADLSKSWVDMPNVRDGNGALIKPEDYNEKLTNGAIVMVNVYMKL